MVIKKLTQPDIDGALKLVLNIFMIFEAPDYIDKGIITFQNCINNHEFIDNLDMYGAFEKDQLVGVIATRNEGNHIALFFVDGKYHKREIGRQLFEQVVKNSSSNKITVNSSPYAIEIYHRLGFVDTNTEQLVDGMRFTPMEYTK